MTTSAGESFSSVDPAAPSRPVTRQLASTPATVRAAVDAAALAAPAWSRTPPGERATIIGGIAHALAKQTHELVDLVVSESGKPIAQAQLEVRKSVEQFHFASQLAYLSEGTTYPEEDAGTFTYTLRGPLGVVVAITPWNFPLSLPARKLAPAIAVGNAVVFKPSPVTPGVANLLVETAHAAGLPSGVLQTVHGDDPAAMSTLVADSRVRALTFTGSDQVGALLRSRVHAHARLQLELGGHNAAVVCADADLERAASDVTAAAFGQAGQTCTATDVVLVERSAAPRFCELLAQRVFALTVGPGSVPGNTCGPVATAAQFQRLTALAESARRDGARVLAQAHLTDELSADGYWVAPTVFTDVPAGHALLVNEVFGPLLSVMAVDDMTAALELINADSHGLVTSVHTADLRKAHRFAREAECGVVKVNGRTTGNGIAPPFGGWKSSSSGAFPEGGRGAIDFFTDTKTVYLTQ